MNRARQAKSRNPNHAMQGLEEKKKKNVIHSTSLQQQSNFIPLSEVGLGK